MVLAIAAALLDHWLAAAQSEVHADSVGAARPVAAPRPAPRLLPVAVEISELPVALTRPVPDGLDDLLEIEQHLQKVAERVVPSTVAVRIGRAQGSGVIVSEDGYVLTAAHVSSGAGREVEFMLADGRKVKGRSLGLNRELDAGLMKIDGDGPWPFVERGNLDDVHLGDWCVATGHPGGFHRDRPPVLRVGRMIMIRDNALQTDCTLVGGDSGGPLFDMRGRVIGINSRIGRRTTWNFHVPISAYHADWDRLLASEDWGGPRPEGGPFLGISGEDHPRGCRITDVGEEMPAAKAGILTGDIITRVDDKAVRDFDSLAAAIQARKPGDEVRIELLRSDQVVIVKAVLARRS